MTQTQPLPFSERTPSTLPGHSLTPLLSTEEIKRRVTELAEEMSNDMAGQDPVLIGVLKGAFIFLADLVREFEFPVTTEFIRVSSYGNKVVTSGEVKMELDVANSIAKRNVILVEDIIDTGLTLEYLRANMKARNPNTLRVCTLLHKPASSVKIAKIDYVGFSIPSKFVVGYGLDYHGYYRNLPYIGVLEELPIR